MTATRLAAGVMIRYPLYWGKWTLGVIALVYTAISVVVASFGTPGEATSVWASIIWLLQWAAFPGGIAVGVCIPLLVAHGITRRRIIAAGAIAVCALAFGVAVMIQAGLAVEWLIYRSRGMPYQVGGSHLFDSIGEVHLILPEYGLNLASFLVAGLLIYLVYYRFGWRGTLVVPLALVPPAGAVTALTAGSLGPVDAESPGWVATIGPAAALALALVAVTAGLLATHALIRNLPLKTK
jgi:hypothetical protein